MADLASPRPPSDEPGRATAEQGVVLLEGPQGAIVTFTPEAAEATGASLHLAAAAARRQRQAREAAPGSVVTLRPEEPRD